MPEPETMKSNRDEGNGEHHVNGENHGESGDIGSRCIQCCKKRSGRVLVCNENGCPVASHEACMTWKPVFDDMGNFYCSYCLYKKERARFEAAKKTSFGDSGNVMNDDDDETIHYNHDDEEKSNEGSVSRGDGVDDVGEGEKMHEDMEVSSYIKDGSHHDSLGDRCIQCCKKRSGQVLICSENGCPVAYHEACMTWKPVFDDMGNFYCSYCLYKREKTRFEESRMKSDARNISRARVFDNVGNLETTEEVEEGEIENGQETSVPEAANKTSSGDSGNVMNDDDDETIHYNRDDEEKSNEGSVSRADGVEDVVEGEKMKEDMEVSSYSKDDSLDLVAFEFASPLAVILPYDSSFQPSTTSENVDMEQEGNTVTEESTAERSQPTKRPTIPIVRDTGKHRKRMPWADAEVDMLQELVHSFSSEVKKNMPWRKILERGRDVFHSTRMPADLKDKWKRIVAKEISEG